MVDFLKSYGTCSGPFGFPMQEDDARDLDKLLNESEDDLKYIKFSKVDSFEYFIEKEHADVSTICDESLDEDKEITLCKNIDWSIFRKNPLVTFNHNYNIPPIGKSLWQKMVAGNVWKAKTVYMQKPSDFPIEKEWFPDSIYAMVKEGFLPGKSIGGTAKHRSPTKEEIEVSPVLEKAKSIRYDVKIYEYSVVTRQANNNAIVEAVAKGLFTIPEDILEKEFLEVRDMIMDIKKQEQIKTPIIKNFTTIKQFEEKLTKDLGEALIGVQKSTPKIVDDVLAKLLGKV